MTLSPAPREDGARAPGQRPQLRARRRLAAVLRSINHRLGECVPADELLDELTTEAEALLAKLDAVEAPRPFYGYHYGTDFDPLAGRANPISPPIVFEIGSESVVGRVTFGKTYEGPEGHVHGGILAAVFDDVLSVTQSRFAAPGVTATLEVSYRRLAPLHAELTFRGRLLRTEGRKTFVGASGFAGDQPFAEAVGLFISS